MPNRQKSQILEEALCKIDVFRENPTHFANFSPIFKEKLNF